MGTVDGKEPVSRAHLLDSTTTNDASEKPHQNRDEMPNSRSSGNETQASTSHVEVASGDGGSEAIGAALYVATSILQQGLDFLRQSLTDEEQLVYQSKLLPGSTIGKHFRHARDHFNLLVQCMAQRPYVLSYDIRTRDTPMERSLPAAISCFQTSIDDLNSMLSVDGKDGSLDHGEQGQNLTNDTPITLNAVTPFPQTLQTSLGRELWFVSLHAIHHYAVVRMLAGELGLEVDETFGIAPSTLRYRNQSEASNAEKAKI